MDGRLWFRIEGSAMSLSSKRTMTDADGKRSLLGLFSFFLVHHNPPPPSPPPHDHQVGRWPATRRSYSACTPLPTSLFRTEVGFSEFVYKYSQFCSDIVIIFDIAGRTMVVATIKKQSAFQLESSADIYIHNVRWQSRWQVPHLTLDTLRLGWGTWQQYLYQGDRSQALHLTQLSWGTWLRYLY